MKIYVVGIYNHILGECEGIECVGAYLTLEEAKNKMSDYAENEMRCNHWILDKDLEGSERLQRLFWGKYDNWDDYFEISIFELDVEVSQDVISLENYVKDVMDSYYEDYKKEYDFDSIDEEDIRNIVFNILDHNGMRDIVEYEIENYVELRKITMKELENGKD